MQPDAQELQRPGRPLKFNRDLVLKKIMEAFWREGFEATSISDLTAATGLNAPSLYAAFGDKKQMFREAMRLYVGDAKAAAAAIKGAPTSFEAAQGLLHASIAVYTGRTTPRGCLLTMASCTGSAESAEIRKDINRLRRFVHTALKKRIAQDVQEHVLAATTVSATLADLVLAIQLGLSILARDGAGRAELTAIVTQGLAAWPENKVDDAS